jgi:hypothetical protein
VTATDPLLEKMAAQVRQMQDATGQATLDLMSKRYDDAETAIRGANDVAQLMAHRLSVEGVKFPDAPQIPAPRGDDGFDLGALASLSSPLAAEMLDRLRDLLPLAEKLDAERGNAMPEEYTPAPGESRGTDVAESISLLILHLKRDVEGARGRGLE